MIFSDAWVGLRLRIVIEVGKFERGDRKTFTIIKYNQAHFLPTLLLLNLANPYLLLWKNESDSGVA